MTWTAKPGQNFVFSPQRDKEMLAKLSKGSGLLAYISPE